MSDILKSLSLDEKPEAEKLVERVRATGAPCLLTRGGQAIAVLVPLSANGAAAGTAADDDEGLLALAGSWRNVDVEALKRYVREGREGPDTQTRDQA